MFSDPTSIISAVGVEPSSQVADFGSGSGHYTKELSKVLDAQGKVFAVEVQKDLVDSLNNELIAKEVKNAMVVWGDVEKENGSRLRSDSIDLVFVCNILFLSNLKEEIIKEARRILKTNGRLVVVDWSESFNNMGPTLEMVFDKQSANTLVSGIGFELMSEIDAGSHHYGLIFKKV